MKIIKIDLSGEEKRQLEEVRRTPSDYRAERALAVLHCADGQKATWIAQAIGRTIGTICSWLHAYEARQLDGLKRDYSPGRPSFRRQTLLPRIEEYLKLSPRDFGWGEDVWSVKVIKAQFQKEAGRELGDSTITRALREGGYSFKRAKKCVPPNAPTKEEKLARVQEIAREISELKATDDVEIVFLDESHFSTDPYVARGWHKRGEPFFPPDTIQTGERHDIWGIRCGKRLILLEECDRGQH